MPDQPTPTAFPVGTQVRTADGGVGKVVRVSTRLKASVLVEFPNSTARAYEPRELTRHMSPWGVPAGGPF